MGVTGEGKVLALDGEALRWSDGLVEGDKVNGFDGNDDGALVGLCDGNLVGLVDGCFIGSVGLGVPGEVTLLDGEAEGCTDGLVDG